MKNTDHPLWKRWTNFRNCCNNTNNASYKYYGGRGIGYDPAWDSFWVFIGDVESTIGPMPDPDALLDRIDNDKGYYIDNICWGTRMSNANDRTTNHKVTYQGRTQSMAEWAREYDMKLPTLWARMTDYGMSFEEAIMTPLQYTKPRK